MEAVFLKLLNMSISAGWLVLAVVVLRFALRKAPKALRVVLWGIVGLRLVWPFSIESILSLIPSKETVPPDIGMAAVPAIHSGVPVVNAVVNPVLGSSMAATPQYSANPMQIAQFIAAWVWVIGMAVMVLYALVSWIVVRFRVREAAREDGRVWICDRIGSPFILGLFCPRIYLPSDMPEADKPYVLAHEQAHLQRRDHWWKPLGFALLTVHWFNPLVWLAYILLCRDIELACDEKVIRQMGEGSKKPYSEALINCSVPRRMIAACPLAFGETGVKGRIKSVLNYKRPAFWIILVAVITCIAVAVCFLTDPRQPDTTATTPTADPSKPSELTISDGSSAIKAWQGGYNWSYERDGEIVHTIADADHPTAVADQLPRLDLLPTYDSHIQGNTVFLTFGQAPDRFSIIALPLDVTSSSGGYISTSTNSFDLLRGEFIYIIQATWNAHGSAKYAFIGSYRVPTIENTDTTLAELQRKYPQYFGLDTTKGLEVYIWQMAPNSYSCVLLPGSNLGYTTEEIMALHQSSLGVREMLLILQSYGVTQADVFVNPIQMPYSSYAYTIDEEYTQALRNYFWGKAPWSWIEDWGLTFTAESRDGKTLTVDCTHEGGQQTGSLYYAGYTLYSEPEQRFLQKLNPPSAADMGKPITALPQGQTQLVLEIEKDFGELPKGNYQLVLDVRDIYDPETVDPNALNLRDSQTYYIPFTIP